MFSLKSKKNTQVPVLDNPSLEEKKTQDSSPKKKKNLRRLLLNIFSITLIVLSVIIALVFFFLLIPGKALYSQVQKLNQSVPVIKQAINDKDLIKVKETLVTIKADVLSTELSYQKFSWAKNLPFIGSYYQDGQQVLIIAKEGVETGEILITAIEPYSDFLGIKGTAVSNEETAEDRITFLTESVEGLVPYLDQIETKIAVVDQAINKIDASRYPEEFRGFVVKANINKLQEAISEAYVYVKNGKPLISKISWLLGKDEPRQFLLIFQNNGELRPTGGFWTAFGLIEVDNGKITPLGSSDIYALDSIINSKIPAPRPIKDYHIGVNYFNVRDMNISPDFPTSIEQFLTYYKKAYPRNQVDAVFALDLNVLTDLVKVLGQVGVSGWGNFSAEPDKRCDGCPNIVYQLEELADKPKSYIDTNRKGFLSPIMNSLLSNAMGSEKSKIGPLAQAMISDINQKHILFYFLDEEMQKAAVLANIAGAITQTDNNTDYLHLNDSNMASAKSNLFITQEIKHEINTKDGKVNHKISVTYTNPTAASNCNLEKGDLCLNAANYRNWFRFYTPQGSTLTKMTGSEVETVQYEELGKQVFEGFYGDKYPLHAKGSSKVTIEYTSSVAATKNYKLLLQKQPGTKPVPYTLIVNGDEQETFRWAADKNIKLSF